MVFGVYAFSLHNNKSDMKSRSRLKYVPFGFGIENPARNIDRQTEKKRKKCVHGLKSTLLRMNENNNYQKAKTSNDVSLKMKMQFAFLVCLFCEWVVRDLSANNTDCLKCIIIFCLFLSAFLLFIRAIKSMVQWKKVKFQFSCTFFYLLLSISQ